MGGYRGSIVSSRLSHDMYNYQQTYNQIKSGNDLTNAFIEPCYKFLMIVFGRYLSMDFVEFYFVIHMICLLIIFEMAYKYTNSTHMIIALYALFIHISNCEQFQNYITLVISTFGLCYLVFEDSTKSRWKYIFFSSCFNSLHNDILYSFSFD